MLFSNKRLFILYGVINILLIILLIILVILYFKEIYILGRASFVGIIALQMLFFFVIKLHYVSLGKDTDTKSVKLRYLKKFTPTWSRQIVTADIPFNEFDGIELEKKMLDIWEVRIFKKTDGQRYQLGPLRMGWLSKNGIEKLKSEFAMKESK
jgi:hypothetical protein